MARRQPPEVRPPRPEVLAFLQAIKEQPDDDTPRLILADWLEEHDDEPRAEFLRVQLQLAQAGKHPRRQALREREHQLAVLHARAWLAPLTSQASNWSFHRGLTRLSLVARDVSPAALLDLVGTEAYAWVDSLSFHGPRAEDVALLVQSRAPPVGQAGSLLGGLTSLSLPHGNAIAGEPLATLAASPEARHLVRLDLSWAAAGDAGAQALASSPSLGRLAALHLPGNNLTQLGAQALAASPHLANLTVLILNHNDLGAEGARALADSKSLTCLTTLRLHHCNLGTAGLTALAASPALGRLREVDLDSNNIGDAGAEALANSPYLTQLTTIDLRANRIGSRGARALADSPYLEQVETLELYRNRLADADVVRLRERFGNSLWL